MCGRFALVLWDSLAEEFGLSGVPPLSARYNVAAGGEIAVVRISPGGGARELALLHWGFVPSWAKAPSPGGGMINARSETAAEKLAFRAAIRRRRCLVPADGFYEWKRRNGRKQPYFVCMRDRKTFGIGGIWELWTGAGGRAVDSCALLTTVPNELLEPIHDRMPVIVAPRDYERWLSPQEQDPASLRPIFRPWPAEAMTAYPVGPAVNNPRADAPGLIEPAG